MAETQKGFLYETNAYNALKKYKIATGKPAGASSDKPDLVIKSKTNKTAGVELKNKPTAAGSLVLKYYDGEWHFGETDNNPEKEFLQSVGEKVGVLKKLNSSWKNPALKYENGKKTYKGFKDAVEAYRYDLNKFGNLYIDVESKVISDYYNAKKCSYMNVGNRGFYLLNNDVLGLNALLKKERLPLIPDFSTPNVAKTKIRVRVQDKSRGNYQFVFTFQFSSIKPSPYNIAPLKSGSSSSIDTSMLNKSELLRIL